MFHKLDYFLLSVGVGLKCVIFVFGRFKSSAGSLAEPLGDDADGIARGGLGGPAGILGSAACGRLLPLGEPYLDPPVQEDCVVEPSVLMGVGAGPAGRDPLGLGPRLLRAALMEQDVRKADARDGAGRVKVDA